YFLAPRLSEMLLGQPLALSGRLFRGARGLAVLGGACGGILVALAPVILLLNWIAPWFDRFYERAAGLYERSLRVGLRRRWTVLVLLAAVLLPTGWAFTHIGQELFPEVDSSEFTVHMRAAGGPRVEETERQVGEIEEMIREVVPPEDLEMILAN